jgi:hypothetical protein
MVNLLIQRRALWSGGGVLLVVALFVVALAHGGYLPNPLSSSSLELTADTETIALPISGQLAKRVPGGILVRGIWDSDDQGLVTPIPGAESFEPILLEGKYQTWYYRTNEAVYHFQSSDQYRPGTTDTLVYPVAIAGADPRSFMPLATEGPLQNIARDNQHVFIAGIVAPELDATSLEAVTPSERGRYIAYFKDARHMYSTEPSATGSRYRVLPFDPATMQLIETEPAFPTDRPPVYVKDAKRVYFEEREIAGADPATFRVLNKPPLQPIKSTLVYSYALDATGVYYLGERVAGADPKTFQPVVDARGGYAQYYYGKDQTRVYHGTTTIPQADPQSFKVLWYPIYEGCRPAEYTADKRHVFYKDAVVPGADAATFAPLKNGTYGLDANGIWEGAKFRPDLPKSFALECNYG